MTTRQMQVLRSIQTYTEEHGHPPSIRDIGSRLGYSTSSGVAYVVGLLTDRGYLATCDRCPSSTGRTLRVTEYGLAMLKVAV